MQKSIFFKRVLISILICNSNCDSEHNDSNWWISALKSAWLLSMFIKNKMYAQEKNCNINIIQTIHSSHEIALWRVKIINLHEVLQYVYERTDFYIDK